MTNGNEKKGMKTGFKEVMNLLLQNRAVKVIIADDCDEKMKISVSEQAKKSDVEIEYVETMRELGKVCGIDVGASCAAQIKL